MGCPFLFVVACERNLVVIRAYFGGYFGVTFGCGSSLCGYGVRMRYKALKSLLLGC